MKKLVMGGTYKHHKGNLYRVIAYARHSENMEELVVYEALYDNPRSKIWVRPKKMFEENVSPPAGGDGRKVPRFKLIKK